MRFRSLIFGGLAAGALSSHPALAQYHRPVRHYNRQERAYFRGPLHVTLGGGTALYNGDLGNSPSDNFLGPALSLGVLYRLTPHLHLGSEFSYVQMGARDKAKERGLAFTSTNGLGTVFFRFDLLPDESVFASSMAEAPVFQVFVQGGAGLLLYNPQAYYGTERANDATSFLPPERNDYPALAGAFPVGAGFGVRLTDKLRANLEGNYYFTTTDQLDDINLRLGGASASKDGFGTVMLKLDYALK
ncbi:outer membrane beta-barrel protein [Hymenobacter siberiensis]|jgi:opacity protein-like surface antigen|uniref:outer membrane beta-barrel protein n=1 Tax=Hymenobacter siberiensis TaxID=2848396 RepID=UPI001C1DD78C|nr:outer membrane beta-barrel protein [Hymenobacter siberiensis]MBU6120380.1 outer membrane beta-barrel protein [Hymenobacter siberiensis]